MDANMLWNVAAYTAQVACIAALGTAVASLLHIDSAGVRYNYWRALLVLCLALPWIQGWRAAEPAGSVTVSTSVDVAEAAVAAPAGIAAAGGIDWLAVVAAVFIAGALARLMWVGASLLSLRRMRTLGSAAPSCEAHDEVQRVVGARAEIRYVEGLKQPVTFGVVRPVVLLPDKLLDHQPAIQQAVLCHELFHVARRDWWSVLSEEAIRVALWFNPAVWWLIAQVQLAREEVVDELSVLATGRRRTYIEALMAFADETPLAPAAAFARRRHLFRRMMLISKEAVMSSRRVVLSCAVMALVMMAGSWYAVSAFPLTEVPQSQEYLREPGPLEMRAKPVTPENPIPRRVNHAAADYPSEAEAVGASATVTLRLTLDELGRVAEIRRTGLRLNATNPKATIAFTNASERHMEALVNSMHGTMPPEMLTNVIDAVTRAAVRTVRQWRYDPPYSGPISFPVTVRIGPEPPASRPAGTILVRGDAQPEYPAGALRVGGNIMSPRKVRDVRPVYPSDAQAARVQGVVILEVLIGSDGAVESARVLRSIPALDQAAIDAVMQWRFTPTLMNGVPVPVIMTVTVNFTLQ